MASVLDELLTSSVDLVETLSRLNNVDQEYELVTQYIRTLNSSVRLQDFENNLEWFNTNKSLSLCNDLKGKVVVIDFFTYCCINCLHILPYLKSLEEEYSVEDGLVIFENKLLLPDCAFAPKTSPVWMKRAEERHTEVNCSSSPCLKIGVHSAKFNNEKDSANILSALQRYGVHHPVVNDAEGIMWQKLSIPCWPTLLVLGSNSEPLFLQVGESNIDQALKFIKAAIKYFRKENCLKLHSLPITPAAHLRPKCNSPLLFPGKVTVCSCCPENPCGNMAVSDTGNHRIVVLSITGKVEFLIGGMEKGFSDGDFSQARFNSPQGLAFQNCKSLFVADTENHAIRQVDLSTCKVVTVAGTGRQGFDVKGGGLWTQQTLSSPWDLCLVPSGEPGVQDERSVLLIAAAGTHQLWALFLKDTKWWKQQLYKEGTCVAIAGTGKEENRNNSYPHAAAFAQPSGLTYCPDLQAIFVADSESSSIRRMSLTDGKVTAVSGGSRSPFDLFQFGDVDGKMFDAKLQHPLAVAWCSRNETLYIADSYNHKIKSVCVSTNFCKTFAGCGNSGDSVGYLCDNAVKFNEPGGLCVSSDNSIIYVADTNNHCIKVIDLESNSVGRLDIQVKNVMNKQKNEFKNVVETKNVKIHPNGGTARLKFIVTLIDGLAQTVGAPQQWSLEFPDDEWLSEKLRGEYEKELNLTMQIPKAKDKKSTSAAMSYKLYLCRTDSQCIMKHFQFILTVHYDTQALTEITETFTYILS